MCIFVKVFILRYILSFSEVKGECQEGVIYVIFFHDTRFVRSNKDAKFDKNSGWKTTSNYFLLVNSL